MLFFIRKEMIRHRNRELDAVVSKDNEGNVAKQKQQNERSTNY